MRRFISYLLLSGATVLGVGAATVPVLLNMDADLAYESGQTLYFRAAKWDDSSINGNYTDENGQFLDFDDGLPAGSKQPITYIADTMRERLDAFGISGYKVETQGSDTIAVTCRAPRDSASLYSALQKYLAFSGGDYELDASDDSGEGYAFNELWGDIIDGQTAKIVDMDQGAYKVPTVVVSLKSGNDYKTAFDDLIKYCKDNTVEADEENNVDGKNCNVVIWSNRIGETDTYKISQSNPNVRAKIFKEEPVSTAVYYDSDDTDKEYPSLRMIPLSAATSGEQYDPSKTQEAYEAARSLMLTFNAGAFQYDGLKRGSEATAPKFAVNYLYSEKAGASVEAFFRLGDWNREVAVTATMISAIVCVAFLVVLLCFFDRVLAALDLAVVSITAFSTLAVFAAFGAQFNIAALIGLTAVALTAAFGTIFYGAKLKEELYKGRTLKKAHTEAVRRSLWPTIDMGIVTIVIGLCVYGLGGDVASKAGVMLVLGGFFGLVANLLYTRIAGWLLCNDSTAAVSFPKMLGVRSESIPDLVKEEKPSYFGPFADRDFSKGRKVSLIATCLFVLAGIGATIGFGVASGGTSFFNSGSYENASPVLHIDVRSRDSGSITITSFREVSDLKSDTFKEGEAPNDVFHTYKIGGTYLADYVTSIYLTTSSKAKSVAVGEGDTVETFYWFYYDVALGAKEGVIKSAISDATKELEITKWNGTSYAAFGATNLSELSSDIITHFVGSDVRDMLSNGAYADDIYITFDNVVPADLTPYLWQIALSVGVGIAAVLVYLCLRFRPSRGIMAGLFVAASAFISTTFFILTRIATLPVVSLGCIPVAMAALGLMLFVLNGEREIFRDSKEKDKNNAPFRLQCLHQATSRQAGNVFFYSLLAFYVAIVFLAFGPRVYGNVYISMVLGVAFALALTLTALAATSGVLGNWFAKINIRKPNLKKKKAKQGGQLMKKRNSAEPEESIFIGIND